MNDLLNAVARLRSIDDGLVEMNNPEADVNAGPQGPRADQSLTRAGCHLVHVCMTEAIDARWPELVADAKARLEQRRLEAEQEIEPLAEQLLDRARRAASKATAS